MYILIVFVEKGIAYVQFFLYYFFCIILYAVLIKMITQLKWYTKIQMFV